MRLGFTNRMKEDYYIWRGFPTGITEIVAAIGLLLHGSLPLSTVITLYVLLCLVRFGLRVGTNGVSMLVPILGLTNNIFTEVPTWVIFYYFISAQFAGLGLLRFLVGIPITGLAFGAVILADSVVRLLLPVRWAGQ